MVISQYWVEQITDRMRKIMLQTIWFPGHIFMMHKYPERLQSLPPEADGIGQCSEV